MNKIQLPASLMILLLSAVLASGLIGCGKKGPPLPPLVKGKEIASVTGLELAEVNEKVILTWKHKTDPENAKIEPDAFEVFMAKKTFEACEGCPFAFKLVQVVSMPEMTCSIPVEKGYRYYFRIQAVNEDNLRSDYSKTVQYEYE